MLDYCHSTDYTSFKKPPSADVVHCDILHWLCAMRHQVRRGGQLTNANMCNSVSKRIHSFASGEKQSIAQHNMDIRKQVKLPMLPRVVDCCYLFTLPGEFFRDLSSESPVSLDQPMGMFQKGLTISLSSSAYDAVDALLTVCRPVSRCSVTDPRIHVQQRALFLSETFQLTDSLKKHTYPLKFGPSTFWCQGTVGENFISWLNTIPAGPRLKETTTQDEFLSSLGNGRQFDHDGLWTAKEVRIRKRCIAHNLIIKEPELDSCIRSVLISWGIDGFSNLHLVLRADQNVHQ